MEEEHEETKEQNLEGDGRPGLRVSAATLPSATFVKVEKNLASLGFFTPSSKRTRDEKAKTVSVTIMMGGKRVEAKATIAPTALFGLPITADQDKWLALHKILSDIQIRDGQVTNPVSFSSAELLALLHIYKNSGKNYRDVSDWLDVMVGTTIISEGAVYSGGKRYFGKDAFHVFDRAVSFGKELPDGSIADKNYVWLSQWQLQNINDHHQLPIDLDTYRELKNFIAKALVPLLQIWLYATKDEGVFEKRYDELCQLLNIRQWRYPSKIREKFAPSLDELKEFGYLSDWRIDRTTDDNFKIVLYHGEKFHRDSNVRLKRSQALNQSTDHHTVRRTETIAESRPIAPTSQPASIQFVDPQLIAEFTRRGITEKKTLEVLAKIKPGQDVVAQLELGDDMVRHARIPIGNPPGFLIRLIESNMSVPASFETSAKRTAREESERQERERRAAEDARQNLEWEYDDYCQREADRFIAEHPAAFDAAVEVKRTENHTQHPGFSSDMIESIAQHEAKRVIRKQITIATFEEFAAKKHHTADFFLKPVAVLSVAPTVSGEAATADLAIADDIAVLPEQEASVATRGEEVSPAPEAAMEPAMPVAAIPQEAVSPDPAPAATHEPGPTPPIGTPSETPEQGMGQGLESSPYPPELPHDSQAA